MINANIYISKLVTEYLKSKSVKTVCIAPGSRNTPLVYTFASDNQFDKFVFWDERELAYFALGKCRFEKNPVVIITTSGTAVAELYPAIIEAFIERLPLIVMTADRPAFLRDTGANQTINQNNIFENHSRFSYDFELPDINSQYINNSISVLDNTFEVLTNNPGPVHLNFQFDKPLEPENEIDPLKHIEFKFKCLNENKKSPLNNYKTFDTGLLKNKNKILITCGPNQFINEELGNIIRIAEFLNAPVFADAASNLRKFNHPNIISNYVAFLQIPQLNIDPELIIHFGDAPTSNSTLIFFEKSKAVKVLMNKYGDIKDPSRTYSSVVNFSPGSFLEVIEDLNFCDSDYLSYIGNIDNKCSIIKKNLFLENKSFTEPVLVNNLMNEIPGNSSVVVGNSLSVRDFDLFLDKYEKQADIFTVRGASGIEGLISFAAGVANNSSHECFLVLGDISFLYGFNGLMLTRQLDIKLNIIVTNNSGCGIFESLPINKFQKIFTNYFKVPHNFDIKKLSESVDYKYSRIENLLDLFHLRNNLNKSRHNIYEIQTNSQTSQNFRNHYIDLIKKLSF